MFCPALSATWVPLLMQRLLARQLVVVGLGSVAVFLVGEAAACLLRLLGLSPGGRLALVACLRVT